MGFMLQTQPQAPVSFKGEPVESTVLKNGDVIEVGAVKLQFWLAEAGQRGLRTGDVLFWMIVSTVTAGQLALIYWLVR